MVYRVISSADAERDLRRAAAYIRRDSPAAARKWLAQIRAQIQTLTRQPERCPISLHAEALRGPIRELQFGRGNRGTYRVLFGIVDDFVIVFRVRHGSMLPMTPEE